MSNGSNTAACATTDVCTIGILVDGVEIPKAYHVLSVSVAKELNRIPAAVIELQDGEAAKSTFTASNSAQFIPGKAIEIQLGYGSRNTTVFKGIVVRHSVKIRKNGGFLIVECRDEAVKMTVGARSRYITGKNDADIIEEVIGAYRLQKDVKPTASAPKDVTQYNSTDWDFLVCRAEANGQVVIASDGKVTVTAPATGAKPVATVRYGTTLLELDVELDARRQSKGIKASCWDPAGQAVTEVEGREPPATSCGNLSAGDLAKAIGDETRRIGHGGSLGEPELQAWADGRLLKERLSKVRGRAKCQGFAGILPGEIMEVTGIGERFEGNLYVSGVRHSVSNGNWETDVQFGLDAALFPETYDLRPLPAAGLLPAVGGLQIGIVTVLENDPDGEERIKVRLPLVSDADEGTWARVATLDAGDGRGTFFRPEIGDEVVAGFLNDDPRHPVVLGMCHSSAKPAPEPAKDANHRKGYVSRAEMRLVFDDEKKSIALETPGGNRMTLSEDGKGIVLEDQNGNTITLDESGINIRSAKDLTLSAANNVKVAGTAGAEVSGANTTIKGSGTTVIKGGVVQIN